MSRQADPPAPLLERPTLFVGREAELDRLVDAFARVPVALVCGVAGVGKTALATAFAAGWPGLVARADLTGPSLAELVDDTGRMVGPGPGGEVGAIASRLRALAERLDAAAGLWIIDDLHRLPPADRRLLFRVVGQTLRRGRLLATSRERVGVDAAGPDHAELRLDGLVDPAARELWLFLDRMYGEAEGFAAAVARSGGNPFLLRRAHAGDLSDEDPVGESIAGLGPEERRVAGALALSGVRLPLSLFERLLADGAVREAMRGLSDRMIVDAHADGTLSMHDLVRDAVLRALRPDERSRLHGDLARLLPDAGLDPARRAREVCRHLRALDRHEEAARYLIERGSELDKYGAAGELLRGFDAIPEDRRSPEASLALARASTRVFDLARAYAEHERLLAAGIGPPVEVALIHALLALLIGRPEVATRSLDRIEGAGELSPEVASRAVTIRSMVGVFAGGPGEGAALLLEAAQRAGGQAAPFWLYRGFALWIEERDGDAYDAIGRALAQRASGDALSYRSNVLTSTVQATVAACLGRFGEAESGLREAELLMAGDEDVLLTCYVRHARTWLLCERGEWAAALPELAQLGERFRAGGYLLGELMSSALEGRIRLVMGHRLEAFRILDRCHSAAHERGLSGIERVIDRFIMNDPARLLDRQADALRRPADRVWDRLAEALRCAAAGEPGMVHALLAAEAANRERPGHELGRVLATTCEAVLAMAGGDPARGRELIAAARAEAARAGIDAGVIAALLSSIGSSRVVSAAGSRIVADPEVEIGPDEVCLDARVHEFRCETKVVSLLRRPMLRRLFYSLAARRGAVVSKDELAAALWSREYNPLTDHGPLKSNIANLRKLVEAAGMSIDFDEVGYRLVGVRRLVLIEPVLWTAT